MFQEEHEGKHHLVDTNKLKLCLDASLETYILHLCNCISVKSSVVNSHTNNQLQVRELE